MYAFVTHRYHYTFCPNRSALMMQCLENDCLKQISAKKIGPSHFFNPAVNEKNHLKVDFYSLRGNKMCKKFKKVIFKIIARYFIKLTLLLLLEVFEGKINCFNNWSLMLLALSLNFDKTSLFYQQILSRLKFCS